MAGSVSNARSTTGNCVSRASIKDASAFRRSVGLAFVSCNNLRKDARVLAAKGQRQLLRHLPHLGLRVLGQLRGHLRPTLGSSYCAALERLSDVQLKRRIIHILQHHQRSQRPHPARVGAGSQSSPANSKMNSRFIGGGLFRFRRSRPVAIRR